MALSVVLAASFALLVPVARASAFEPWTDHPAVVSELPSLAGAPAPVAGSQGRVTLVHFFATWCAPCKDELASLDRLARAMDGRSLAIVAVDAGEPAVRVRRFFEAMPVTFPILLDEDRAAMKAWDVLTFPTTYVVGPDGRTGWKVEGDVAWDEPSVVGRLESLLHGADTQKKGIP